MTSGQFPVQTVSGSYVSVSGTVGISGTVMASLSGGWTTISGVVPVTISGGWVSISGSVIVDVSGWVSVSGWITISGGTTVSGGWITISGTVGVVTSGAMMSGQVVWGTGTSGQTWVQTTSGSFVAVSGTVTVTSGTGVVISGQTVTVTGGVQVSGAVQVSGSVISTLSGGWTTISGVVSVSGAVSVSGNVVYVSGTVAISSGTVIALVSGTVSVSGTVGVVTSGGMLSGIVVWGAGGLSGAVSITTASGYNDVTVSGTLGVSGTVMATLSGGWATISGVVPVSASGRITIWASGVGNTVHPGSSRCKRYRDSYVSVSVCWVYPGPLWQRCPADGQPYREQWLLMCPDGFRYLDGQRYPERYYIIWRMGNDFRYGGYSNIRRNDIRSCYLGYWHIGSGMGTNNIWIVCCGVWFNRSVRNSYGILIWRLDNHLRGSSSYNVRRNVVRCHHLGRRRSFRSRASYNSIGLQLCHGVRNYWCIRNCNGFVVRKDGRQFLVLYRLQLLVVYYPGKSCGAPGHPVRYGYKPLLDHTCPYPDQ